MTRQKQLILQETFESCSLAMQDLLAHAGDLESVGFLGDAFDVREAVGKIEEAINKIRQRHS